MKFSNACRMLMALVALLGLWCYPGGASGALPLYEWSPVGPYNGGVVLSVAVDQANPSVVYSGLDAGGVYKSTDGGTTWQSASKGIEGFTVYAVAIDPSAASTLYAGTNDGVYKSFDGGGTWNRTSNGITSNFAFSVAIKGTTIYAGTSTGIFRSSDGGSSWTLSLPSSMVQSLAVTTAGGVFAGTAGGVYRSTDDGATWTLQNTGLPSLSVTVAAASPTDPLIVYAGTGGGGVYKTVDGGDHWAPASSGVSDGYIRSLTINRLLPDTVYAGTNAGAFRTTTGGSNWSLISSIPRNAAIYAIAATPTSPATVFAGANAGIYKSSDGGINWSLSNTGMTSLNVQTVLVNPVVKSTVYTGANGGIYRSTNRGTTWQSIPTGLGSLNVHAIIGHSSNASLLYAATEAGIFRSVNGGSTWMSYSAGLPSLTVPAIAINPVNASVLYAGTEGGVAKSTDGGATWNLASSGITDLRIRSLAIHPSSTNTVYAGTVNGLFKTTDGGDTWIDVSNGITDPLIKALAIDPAAPETIFAATNNGVFRSTDGGTTWFRTMNGILNSFVSTFYIDATQSPSSVVYVGTDGGIFYSTDGGNDWAGLNGGLTNKKVRALSFDPTLHTLFAGTWGSGVYRLPAIDITVSPAPYDFGNVALHTSSDPVDFVLSNTNSYTVNVSSIALSGTGSTMFHLVPGTCPSLSPSLAPGQSCTVRISFTPEQLGTNQTNLTILSNSINYPALNIPVSGTGIVQAFSLTILTSGTGSGTVTPVPGTPCSGSCSAAYSSGATVDLTATAGADSTFSAPAGWSGCDSLNGSVCQVVMDGPKKVTAIFDKAFQLSPLYPWVSSGLPGVQVNCLATLATAPSILYAGTNTAIYRSTDGGKSWGDPLVSSLTAPVQSIAIDPVTPATVYVATGVGILKSTDDGTTWAWLEGSVAGRNVRSVVVNPLDTATVYAGTAEGVFKSTDSGATWTAANTDLASLDIRSLAIDPATPAIIYAGAGGSDGGVFKSTNGASSWSRVRNGIEAFALAIDPAHPSTVYAGGSLGTAPLQGGVIVSTDGGITWPGGTGPLADTVVYSLAIDPHASSKVYAGIASGALMSGDSGVTWNTVSTGISARPVFSLAVTGSTPGTAFAGTDSGVYKLTFASIVVSPARTDFSSVNLGKSSSPHNIQISNTGTSDLKVDSITLSGADPANFDLMAGTCLSFTPTIKPGESCSLSVSFTPIVEGSIVALLRVHSNDPAATVKYVDLVGNGVIALPDGDLCINDPNCNSTIIGSTSSPDVTLYVTAEKNVRPVTHMRFSNDNFIWSTWEPFQSTKRWTLPTGDGTKTVYMQLRDDVNTSLIITGKIYLNTQAPVATITSMPVGQYSSSAGTFSFDADQAGCTFECRIDGNGFAPCASPFSFSNLPDGSHTFFVRATNAAGILQTTTSSYSWNIDTVAPDTSIVSGPTGNTYAVPVIFTFSSPDFGATFQCNIDSEAYVACASPYTVGGLTAGTHAFHVRAVDQAGNVDPTPAALSWTTMTPTTTITSKPVDPATTTSATFEFTSPVVGATFECSMDFGVYTACSSPATYNTLGIGSHTFSVRAKDAAGNVGPNPPRYSWTILYGPIKVVFPDGRTNFYSTFTEAFGAIPAGTSPQIFAQNLVYGEDASLASAGSNVIIRGGYESTFGSVVGTSIIRGSLVITQGTAEVSDLVIM